MRNARSPDAADQWHQQNHRQPILLVFVGLKTCTFGKMAPCLLPLRHLRFFVTSMFASISSIGQLANDSMPLLIGQVFYGDPLGVMRQGLVTVKFSKD